MSYTEEYERPTIQKHSMLFTLSPAGCKLGHGLFPFQKRRKLDQPPINFAPKETYSAGVKYPIGSEEKDIFSCRLYGLRSYKKEIKNACLQKD
ncbi:hypothetical protein KKH56_08200 [bacterium]|nr:hypothetical protein [bacterium]